MKVKRFFAPDMGSAMRLVRDEVGPEAVILSNNSVAGGVEVVVALEYQDYAGTRSVPPVQSSSARAKSKPLVGMRRPLRSLSDDRARATENPRSRSALKGDLPGLLSERAASVSLEALTRRAEEVQTPTHKDRQLTLDDVSWDEVLESLNRKAAEAERRRNAPEPAARQTSPRRRLKSAGVTSTPALRRAQTQAGVDDAPAAEVAQGLDIDRLLSDKPVTEQSRRPAVRTAPAAGTVPRAEPWLDEPAAADDFFGDQPMPPSVPEDVADIQLHGEQKMLQSMRRELDELKSILRTRLKDSASQVNAETAKNSSPVRDRIRKRLRRLNIEERLSARLVQAIEAESPVDKAWKTALSRLADALPSVGENIAERGGVLAFVGATGVGKTTTIGKIAAQYVLKHGSSSVALVTTDSFRIAAHEQLKTFGRILDIPVRVVDENHSLDDILHNLRDKRLVLVDTSGLSTSEQQRKRQMEMLQSSSYRIKKFLVLPATAQYRILKSCYEHFKSLGLNGSVLTKVDESVSLGEVLSLVVEQRLPLAYVADGQKVPDDIEVARSNSLVSRAVVLAEQQARADRAVQQNIEPDTQPLYVDRVG